MVGKYMYIKYALHFYYNMSPPENQDESRKIRRKKRENARHPTSVFPKNTFCKQNHAFALHGLQTDVLQMNSASKTTLLRSRTQFAHTCAYGGKENAGAVKGSP